MDRNVTILFIISFSFPFPLWLWKIKKMKMSESTYLADSSLGEDWETFRISPINLSVFCQHPSLVPLRSLRRLHTHLDTQAFWRASHMGRAGGKSSGGVCKFLRLYFQLQMMYSQRNLDRSVREGEEVLCNSDITYDIWVEARVPQGMWTPFL